MTTMPASTIDSDLGERAHDLRNLFGAIASARHLLDDRPDEPHRRQILDAIEQAAQRGDALTTGLLQTELSERRERVDVRARVDSLAPLLRTIVGAGNHLVLDLGDVEAPVRAAPDRLDHVVIELVANARAALTSPGTIRVRVRARHSRVGLIVCDTGCGMADGDSRSLLTRGPPRGAHGTGFRQVRRFVEDLHGTLRLRSRPGAGTLVAFDFPILLGLDR